MDGRFSIEWSPQKCFQVLRDYEESCRNDPKRQRGNTLSVIHAVRCLKGMFETGKFCEECTHRVHTEVELHHIDGDWRNYSFNNLIFLCSSHHHLSHVEEEIMTQVTNGEHSETRKNRYKWQDEYGNPTEDTMNYSRAVDAVLTNDPTALKEKTYLEVGKSYGITNVVSANRVLRLARGIKVSSAGKGRKGSGPKKAATGQVRMTVKEFDTFLERAKVAKELGIQLVP